MNKEILYEINRYREIMGIKLLSEDTGNPKWFVSNSSDDLMSAILDVNPNFQGQLDDIAYIMSKDIDDIADPFVREFRKSIDDLMNPVGGGTARTLDEILGNERLRYTVEKMFLDKVKKNANSLLDEFVNDFYAKNPDVLILLKPTFVTNSIAKAAKKGITDLDQVKNTLNKIVDDWYVEVNGVKKNIPDIIKKDIKDVIEAMFEKGVTPKVTKEAIENTITNVISLAGNPKIASKLKTDKVWRDRVRDLLIKHGNDINKVTQEFNTQVTKWARESGQSDEKIFTGVQKYLNDFFNFPVIKQLKWNESISVGQNWARIGTTLAIGFAAIPLYYAYYDDLINNNDSPDVKSIRMRFGFLPKTLRDDYFNFIIQKLGGTTKGMEILNNPNVLYTWDVYDPGLSDYVSETEYLTTISLDGKELKFDSDNEGEDIGKNILSNTFTGAGGGGNSTLNNGTSSTFKVAELTKFLTGPDYGFKAAILLPTNDGSFAEYTGDQVLGAGTYKFQDSTPESENGPLNGQVKYENGVFTYIPE